MQNYYLVCDYREKMVFNNEKNDHYSYKSITNIINTINSLGYNCLYFGGVKELITAIQTGIYDKNGIYLNFNDGLFSASKRGQAPILLELMKVKYSGSSPLTHLAVSDKFFTNQFLKDKIDKLLIPDCSLISNRKDLMTLNLSFPIILKPNDEGSSLGIDKNSICNNLVESFKQYEHIKDFGNIIAQEFINGYELTNYFITNNKQEILFNEIVLISKNSNKAMNYDLFSYDDKANHKRNYYNPIEVLKPQDINVIKNVTAQIAKSLNILTLGRIDYKFFNNDLYFIEANSIPAFSVTSDIGEICRLYGYSFANILKLLLNSLN